MKSEEVQTSNSKMCGGSLSIVKDFWGGNNDIDAQ